MAEVQDHRRRRRAYPDTFTLFLILILLLSGTFGYN